MSVLDRFILSSVLKLGDEKYWMMLFYYIFAHSSNISYFKDPLFLESANAVKVEDCTDKNAIFNVSTLLKFSDMMSFYNPLSLILVHLVNMRWVYDLFGRSTILIRRSFEMKLLLMSKMDSSEKYSLFNSLRTPLSVIAKQLEI